MATEARLHVHALPGRALCLVAVDAHRGNTPSSTGTLASGWSTRWPLAARCLDSANDGLRVVATNAAAWWSSGCMISDWYIAVEWH
jgi:hypothetical protein